MNNTFREYFTEARVDLHEYAKAVILVLHLS